MSIGEFSLAKAFDFSLEDWQQVHLFACQVAALQDYDELLCYATARLLEIQTEFFARHFPLFPTSLRLNVAIGISHFENSDENSSPSPGRIVILPDTMAYNFDSPIFSDSTPLNFELNDANLLGRAILERRPLCEQKGDLTELILPLFIEEIVEGVVYLQANHSIISEAKYETFLSLLIKALPVALFNARRYAEMSEKVLQFQTVLYNQISEQTQQLLNRNQELETFINHLNEGLMMLHIEKKYRIVQVNPLGLKLFGWGERNPSIEEISNPGNYQVFKPSPAQNPVANFAGQSELPVEEAVPFEDWPASRVARGQTFNNYELIMQGPDGIRRHLSFGGSPVRDIDDKVRRAIIIFRDVTELKEVERLKDDFIALVSHDLRAPLSAILGYAQVAHDTLASYSHLPELGPAIRSMQIIARQSTHLNQLVVDLLDMARLENGNLRLDKEPLNLGLIVHEICERIVETLAPPLQPATAPQYPRLLIDVEAGLPRISLDLSRIEQVLTNLISNAVKYSPAESVVEIKVRHEVALSRLIISIKDQGIGVEPEKLPKLFNRFYRTDQARHSGLQGVGLGLYLSRLIVEAHGGKIWAESPGSQQGSIFYIALPL